MKILAVRGKNLASLGEFSVDFERGPLAAAGVFAITGPTGSGKSTLLDALCLALYDRTPRLGTKRSNVLVGHSSTAEDDRVRVSDPRALLRHGAANGFAEVDFAGVDGVAYRARWSVHRARGKASGRLQKQSVTLVERDTGKALAGNKSEVLPAIQEKLGLSFDQFRRSVLLAQGDFAAFLRADEKERADLLERMTGTDIYGAISIAAYRRAERERNELAAEQSRLQGCEVLEPAERAARDTELEKLATQLEAAKVAIETLKEAAGFWATKADLEQKIRAASDKEKQASAALDERKESADKVQQFERSQVALRVLSDMDAEALRGARMAQELAELREQEKARATEVATLEKSVRQAQATLEELRREFDAVEPEIKQAGELDTQLAILAEKKQTTTKEREDALQALERVKEATQAGERACEAKDRQLEELEHWFEENASLAAWAEAWPKYHSSLERYRRFRASLSEADSSFERCDSALKKLSRERDSVQTKLREIRERLHEASAKREASRKAADAESVSQARSRIDAARAAHLTFSELTRISALFVERRELRESAVKRSQELEVALVGHDERLKGLGASQIQCQASLREAERSYRQLRVAGELSMERARLVSGEPCTVCGSTEHPWAEGGIVDELVHRSEERIRELEAEQKELAEHIAGETTARGVCQHELAALAETLAPREEADGELQAEWQEAMSAAAELAGLEDPERDETREWLRRRLLQCEEELEQANGALVNAEALLKEATEANERVEARRSDLEQVQLHSSRVEAQYAELERELAVAKTLRKNAEAEIKKLREELSPLGDEEYVRLKESPGAFVDTMAAAMERWFEAAKTQGKAQAERERIRLDIGHAKSEGKAILDRTTKIESGLASLAAEHKELVSKREALLGGVSIEVFRADMSKRRGLAERAVESTRHSFEAARTVLEEVGKGVERLDSQLRAARHRFQELREQLSNETARLESTEAQLRELGELELEWVESERRFIEGARASREEARAVHRERSADLEKHVAAGEPQLCVEEIVKELAVKESSREELAAEKARVQALLASDDQAHEERKKLAAVTLQAEAKAKIYASLSELIGSADGKKFRVFAQSLTLETLLGFANQHLFELVPRYFLARVPGHDLEIQVIDREMGDEIRSVHSLSGGESFLVSLALALGLSSLSAQDTQIESLLIDEGFGTLDPVTLDVALSVLDALQASGRKVGLISHVPGLAERVGARVELRPRGGGLSEIHVVAPH